MNKVFSLSIIVVLMSFCNASAMKRRANVNQQDPVENKQVCPPLRYREHKRERAIEAEQNRQQERFNNNADEQRHVRRNLQDEYGINLNAGN